MRKITPAAFTVYTLDELEPDARRKAIEGIAAKVGDEWWDRSDNGDIRDVMVYTLANKFGTPGHGDWGVHDFPGIDGVSLESWDLDQGSYVALRGVLTRENAPALPWDGVVEVTLTDGRAGTSVDVEYDDDPARYDTELVVSQMGKAVQDALRAALRDGRAEAAYKTSYEYAEERIEANGYEFCADGTLYV